MNKLTLFLLPLCLFAADHKEAPAPNSAAISIPAGAQQLGPYTFRATGTDGRTWVYQRSPFGILKMQEIPELRDHAAPDVPVTVIDKGESIRFELPTPFGPQVWEHSKSALTQQDKEFISKFGGAASAKASER